MTEVRACWLRVVLRLLRKEDDGTKRFSSLAVTPPSWGAAFVEFLRSQPDPLFADLAARFRVLDSEADVIKLFNSSADKWETAEEDGSAQAANSELPEGKWKRTEEEEKAGPRGAVESRDIEETLGVMSKEALPRNQDRGGGPRLKSQAGESRSPEGQQSSRDQAKGVVRLQGA